MNDEQQEGPREAESAEEHHREAGDESTPEAESQGSVAGTAAKGAAAGAAIGAVAGAARHYISSRGGEEGEDQEQQRTNGEGADEESRESS
jgi:hypothetical protein